MKKVLLSTITVYQKVISPLLHQLLGIKKACRYDISCTVYAKEAIKKYGAGRGTILSMRRVLNCQPFFSL